EESNQSIGTAMAGLERWPLKNRARPERHPYPGAISQILKLVEPAKKNSEETVTANSQSSSMPWYRAGAWVVVLAIAFSRPLYALITQSLTTDLNSYELLIPVITAYLVYCRLGS